VLVMSAHIRKFKVSRNDESYFHMQFHYRAIVIIAYCCGY
jgi:uncharacterized protein YegP (UPF0339 family)